MRQTHLPQINEIIIILNNINDNIRRIENELSNTNLKLAKMEQKMSGVDKHLVVIKTANKKTKETAKRGINNNGRL